MLIANACNQKQRLLLDNVTSQYPIHGAMFAGGSRCRTQGGRPSFKDASLLDMAFSSITNSRLMPTRETACEQLSSTRTVNAVRTATAHVLKEESFSKIETLQTRKSCPESRFGVVKLTWDETPQRISLRSVDMEKLFGTNMWKRLEPGAQLEEEQPFFSGGTASAHLSTVTVQIMQRSAHIRMGHLMDFTGPLFHPPKMIETNSASNIMASLCEASPLNLDFLQKVNLNNVAQHFNDKLRVNQHQPNTVSENYPVFIVQPLCDALAANKLVQHRYAEALPKALVPRYTCASHAVPILVLSLLISYLCLLFERWLCHAQSIL